MTAAQMRSVPHSTTSRWKSLLLHTQQLFARNEPSASIIPIRNLAQVRPETFSELWFTSSFPARINANQCRNDALSAFLRTEPLAIGGTPGKDHKPPDERTLKLGETLRTLSPLLPNILTTALPQEIVSPSVSLHLFPSTHPHLPVVKGRIAYRAALWTAPVAWGSVPVVGNVKLHILSEKIIRSGLISAPTSDIEQSNGLGEEKLVVKWRTEKKNGGNHTEQQSNVASSSAVENGGINRGLSTLLGGDKQLFRKDGGSDTFSGLFVFSFDSKGRIASHTIEHADEASGFDQTSRVVTLADWLLGKARWRGLREEENMPVPGLAYRMRVCREDMKRPQP